MIDSPDNSFISDPSAWNESLSAGSWKVSARISGQPIGPVTEMSKLPDRLIIRTPTLNYGEGLKLEMPKLGQQVIHIIAYSGKQFKILQMSKNDQVRHNDETYYFVNKWQYFPVDRVDVMVDNHPAPISKATIIKLPTHQAFSEANDLPFDLLDIQSNSSVSKDGFNVFGPNAPLEILRSVASLSYDYPVGKSYTLAFTAVSPNNQTLELLINGKVAQSFKMQAGVIQNASINLSSAGANELVFRLPTDIGEIPFSLNHDVKPLVTFSAFSAVPK